MANGSTACLIVGLYGVIGGRSGAVSVLLQLGSAQTGWFGMPGGVNGTGMIGTSYWLVNGGSTTFYMHFSGQVYFGRGSGGTTWDSTNWSWSGGLTGTYRYVQAPSAPQSVAISNVQSTSMTVAWAAPADTTELGVSGYEVQYATDAAFTTGVQTKTVSTLSATLTGLTPGVRYYVRVSAKNPVTDAAGTVGPRSGATEAKTLSGAYVSDGSTFGTAEVYVGNGSTWPLAEVYVGDGTSWSPAL
jgi:hypothetical protein